MIFSNYFCLYFQVEGFDRDLGFNGDLLYVISDGDYDSAFKLDTLTGELFVDGPLDREKTSDYLLNITVQDQGSPRPKFVSKLLHVSLYMIAKNYKFLLYIYFLRNYYIFLNFTSFSGDSYRRE